MKQTYIDELKNHISDEVTLKGWILCYKLGLLQKQSKRRLKLFRLEFN